MKTTLFIVGPTDSGAESTTNIKPDGADRVKGSAQWQGCLPLLPFVTGDPTLHANSIVGLVGVHEFNQRENAVLNLFNLVGDADSSAKTLTRIRIIGENLRPARYFNRPEHVLKTARDKLPVTLANIAGCRVPRVKSADPKSFEELATVCSEFSAWPLILRARGYHGGVKMCLLDDLSQLDTLENSPWLYEGIVLAEFVNYRAANGLYEKFRVIMVDGVAYPRHAITSDQPFVHAKNRSDLMDGDAGLRRHEETFLASLRDVGLKEKKYREIFDAIYRRIGLDIFGIDFAEIDGDLLIFEANPCMHFLDQDYGPEGQYRYLEPHIRTLKRAVKKLLMKA